jgi:hypothetical protein
MMAFAMEADALQTGTENPAPAMFDFGSVISDNKFALMGIVLLGVIALGYLVARAARYSLRKRSRAGSAVGSVILKVSVPKDAKATKDGGDDNDPRKIQERISVMETIFQTVGSLKAQKGPGTWLFGRTDELSFEIVFERNKIRFYVVVPRPLHSFIEEQIHAQFPDAEIEAVADYNIFTPTGVILGSYLVFRKPSMFPVKTYDKLESDPLNSLTNALARLGEGEGASVQVIIRSAPKGWRKEGIRIARAMQQGKRLSDVQAGGFSKDFARAIGKDVRQVAFGSKKDGEPNETYRLSPLEEEMIKGLEEKASKAGLEANVRVVVCAKTPQRAQQSLSDILQSFGQYNVYEYGNAFVKASPRMKNSLIEAFIYRSFSEPHAIVMNSAELASVYHFPLPSTETPKIGWLLARKALPPSNIPDEGIVLGYSEYRGHRYVIRMTQQDRRRHMYVIGKSGTGKSQFMKSLIKQDIEAGRGVCVMDPHGELAREVLELVPRERADDVIYFSPGDTERPLGLNMLEYDPSKVESKERVVGELLKIFDRLFDLKQTGGPMFEYYMRNTLLLIMDHPESGSTLLEIPRVLADEEFRRLKLSKCRNQQVKDFWIKEAQKAGGEAALANMVPYIASKLAPFITNEIMRPIIGQQKSAFNVREAMDSQKILLLDLAKGKLGDLSAYLIGMVLVGKILNAALERGDMDPGERKDFYLYIDEFQNFLTDSISAILSEARKYGLNLIVGHQFIGQLDKMKEIRDAIFGNVGSMFAFRIGPEDAEFVVKEFKPVFSEYDLVNAEAFTCNAKILIGNTASRPFNMHPIMPEEAPDAELKELIKELSRYKYGRRRELVEAEIRERSAAVDTMIEKGAF